MRGLIIMAFIVAGAITHGCKSASKNNANSDTTPAATTASGSSTPSADTNEASGTKAVKTALPVTGAEQILPVLDKLRGKNVALVVNYTAMVGKTHLADTLRALGVNIIKIMSPEHGFRGNATAGEHVSDGLDTKTGLPVVSLYGKGRKPTPEQLADVDIVVFDIQDVGVRFFTYVGTLHYVMEACAENNRKVIVLDRPNPNAGYIDGPIMHKEFETFIGMHAVPVVHGLTVGEYAGMINGEGWLAGGRQCALEVVTMKNWKHSDEYILPIKPSPNLPNQQSIKLYPSVCFFEGTALSLGRGTQMPFQVIGHPDLKNQPFSFTPVDIPGMAVDPPLEGKLCHGLDLRKVKVEKQINLSYLISMYNAFPVKDKFFVEHFGRWAGSNDLAQQIKSGMTEEQIRATWQNDLQKYKVMRRKYLLYE
ncbi:DUF1343 domain-containing protein [Chryseolinea sp. T2]|uniref:exo-beta-N-acetylmuramidase NamZ family protein n=1 Tax=Chryseolinea sp. T2 TaxID=3129255 RepID=UPI003077F0BC